MSLVVHSTDRYAVYRADDDPSVGAFGARVGPMSGASALGGRLRREYRADDDPSVGAFGAGVGPMSLVVHSTDRYAVYRADDETRTRNILLGRQRL